MNKFSLKLNIINSFRITTLFYKQTQVLQNLKFKKRRDLKRSECVTNMYKCSDLYLRDTGFQNNYESHSFQIMWRTVTELYPIQLAIGN
jgi:hypothetical protein